MRKDIRPGNNKSLWTAVNKANDVGSPEIPNNMFREGRAVPVDKIEPLHTDNVSCETVNL